MSFAELRTLPTGTTFVVALYATNPNFAPGIPVVDVSSISGIAAGWVTTDGGRTFAAPAAPTLAQLATQLEQAASSACAAITAQVVPDQTHQLAYANAASIVGPSATVPTVDPLKTAFTNMATENGFSNPQTFATLVVNIAAASLTLSTILTTLEAAAAAATTSAQLASALATFEASIGALVTSLNSAGLTVTITAPPAITITGINA